MANKYVSTTGSDAADGSLATPWLTLAYAFANISQNDELWIRGGIYAGDLDGCTLPSGSSDGTRTIIRAYTDEVPIIQGFNNGIKFATGGGSVRSFISFIDLVIDGAQQLSFATTGGFYVGFGSTYITLQDCVVKDWNKSTQHGVSGIEFTVGNGNSDNCRIIGCEVYNNGNPSAGGGVNQQHGIYIAGTNQLVEDCSCYNNAGYGIHIYNSGIANSNDGTVVRNNRCYNNSTNPNWGSAEFLVQDGDNLKVYNNIAYRLNATGNGDLGAVGNGDNIQVYNNTMYTDDSSDGGFTIKAGTTNAIVRNNIVYGASFGIDDDGTSSTLSNNLTTDPDFVNVAGANFDLASTSDAIDTGFDTSAVLTDDIIGTARPQGDAFDIGAYEYIFPPAPPASGEPIIGIVGGL